MSAASGYNPSSQPVGEVSTASVSSSYSQLVPLPGYSQPVTQAGPVVYMGFEAEIHTGNNEFSIHNTATAGIRISRVVVNLLGGNIQVDTVLGGLAFNPLDRTLVLADGVASPTINNIHFTGGPFPGGYTTTTAAAVGYTGTLSTDVPDGGRLLTFNFTDFDRHEAWGFRVDYDQLTANTAPRGPDVNGVKITVTFADAYGHTDTLEYLYTGNGGKKVSFPTDADAVLRYGPSAPSSVLQIPEPASRATALLLGVAGMGLAWHRRRQEPRPLARDGA